MAAGPSSAAIGSSSAVAGPSSAAVGSSSAAADPSCALVALRALPLDLRAGPSRAGHSLSTAAGSLVSGGDIKEPGPENILFLSPQMASIDQ